MKAEIIAGIFEKLVQKIEQIYDKERLRKLLVSAANELVMHEDNQEELISRVLACFERDNIVTIVNKAIDNKYENVLVALSEEVMNEAKIYEIGDSQYIKKYLTLVENKIMVEFPELYNYFLIYKISEQTQALGNSMNEQQSKLEIIINMLSIFEKFLEPCHLEMGLLNKNFKSWNNFEATNIQKNQFLESPYIIKCNDDIAYMFIEQTPWIQELKGYFGLLRNYISSFSKIYNFKEFEKYIDEINFLLGQEKKCAFILHCAKELFKEIIKCYSNQIKDMRNEKKF